MSSTRAKRIVMHQVTSGESCSCGEAPKISRRLLTLTVVQLWSDYQCPAHACAVSLAPHSAPEHLEGRAAISVAFAFPRCSACTDSHCAILCSAVENLEPFLKPGASVLDVGTFGLPPSPLTVPDRARQSLTSHLHSRRLRLRLLVRTLPLARPTGRHRPRDRPPPRTGHPRAGQPRARPIRRGGALPR